MQPSGKLEGSRYSSTGTAVNPLPFRTLLYRYFFFGWLFKPTDVGDVFERAAAERHNREQARWLPVYIMRWLWLGLGLFLLGRVAEVLLEAPGMAVLCYAISAMSMSFTITIASAWLGIKGAHRFQ
jgi:hypothetical protein